MWEFAVGIDELTALGLSQNDFRWLVRKGWVEHQREVTLEGDNGRAFRPSGDLTFPPGTCFVLTEAGMAPARALAGSEGAGLRATVRFAGRQNNMPDAGTANHRAPRPQESLRELATLRPRWDAERRLLSINGTTVKWFKWAAYNQEAILAAFQEEGWPARIDDPLPPHPEQDPKRRLSDTIKCLNRRQKNELIHFRGDGTGEGVAWELLMREPPEHPHGD